MTEESRCIPWFYPPLDRDTRLCSPFEAEDFKSVIKFMSPNDCEVRLKMSILWWIRFNNVCNISSTVYPTVRRLDTLQACQLQSSIDATQSWWDRTPCAACLRLWLGIRPKDFPLATFPCGAQVLWMTTGNRSRQTKTAMTLWNQNCRLIDFTTLLLYLKYDFRKLWK